MIVLDTSAVIEVLKGSQKGEKIADLIGADETAVTAFSVYEMLVGAKSNEIPKIEAFFNSVRILSFNHIAALESARLEMELKAKGRMIEKVDIFISSICIASNSRLITLDNDFREIENLEVEIV
ncbi:MAG: type II toxin-antitoxin system VapC family toxin [Candidatus Aenigmarchaeota archaeon]|nr:type II toxin-antitoxin system VapC family toxin [Candidatus Aenigmarchaeota archaeon]